MVQARPFGQPDFAVVHVIHIVPCVWAGAVVVGAVSSLCWARAWKKSDYGQPNINNQPLLGWGQFFTHLAPGFQGLYLSVFFSWLCERSLLPGEACPWRLGPMATYSHLFPWGGAEQSYLSPSEHSNPLREVARICPPGLEQCWVRPMLRAQWIMPSWCDSRGGKFPQPNTSTLPCVTQNPTKVVTPIKNQLQY